MKPITLEVTSVRDGARTYMLHPRRDGGGQRDLGWSIVIIDDRTGTLAIVSDWGNWSHVWGTRHLGAIDLTHFIAHRSDVGYLHDKLLPDDRQRQFSADRSVDNLIELLKDRRRHDIHTHGRQPELDVNGYLNRVGRMRERYLTHQRYTELVQDIEELRGETHAEPFMESLPNELGDYLSDLYESLGEEATLESKHLRQSVLPAIVAACMAEVHRRFYAQTDVQQLMMALLDGAGSRAHRMSLPVCACNIRSSSDCPGAHTQPLGTRCGFWGALCGGLDPKRVAHVD